MNLTYVKYYVVVSLLMCTHLHAQDVVSRAKTELQKLDPNWDSLRSMMSEAQKLKKGPHKAVCDIALPSYDKLLKEYRVVQDKYERALRSIQIHQNALRYMRLEMSPASAKDKVIKNRVEEILLLFSDKPVEAHPYYQVEANTLSDRDQAKAYLNDVIEAEMEKSMAAKVVFDYWDLKEKALKEYVEKYLSLSRNRGLASFMKESIKKIEKKYPYPA